MIEMIRKSRLDALRQFWLRESQVIGGVDAVAPEWCGERQMTPLHFAAEAGSHDVVRWLLEEEHASPVISSGSLLPDSSSMAGASEVTPNHPLLQVPYDVASTREVRNVFRRCAAAHPDWWDWFGEGHVPSILSKEMEQDREEKKKARRKGLRDKVKEREAATIETVEYDRPSLDAPTVPEEASSSTSNKLGGRSGDLDSLRGLSKEMQAKVERERRARAAEVRAGK